MVEIKHRRSGRVVLTVDTETLAGANLAGEYLIHADLTRADLASAQLPFANLSGADLSHADLSGANLRGANLVEADLTGAELNGVNLTDATVSLTDFSECRNLHRAVGLESLKHHSPSTLDEPTLRTVFHHLPDSFLRGLGYTRSEIADMRRRFLPSG